MTFEFWLYKAVIPISKRCQYFLRLSVLDMHLKNINFVSYKLYTVKRQRVWTQRGQCSWEKMRERERDRQRHREGWFLLCPSARICIPITCIFLIYKTKFNVLKFLILDPRLNNQFEVWLCHFQIDLVW